MKSNDTQFSLALITGATSGIGLQLCEILSDQGISLIIQGRDEEKLKIIAKKLKKKVDVSIVVAELNHSKEQQLVSQAIQKHVPDLVINCAGFGLYGDALDYDIDAQLDVLRVNALALARLTLEAAQALKNNGKTGVIMNISSAASFPISPKFSMYSASKAFVNQFSESFDKEVKSYGIRVLTACPGVVDTNFRQRANGQPLSINENAMTANFAAQEIWKQITSRKTLHIFNWYYRTLVFLVKYIIPKSLVAKLVSQRIGQLKQDSE